MADYTILIIDYNPRSVESIKSPLEQAGYRVEVATDGISGIKAFEALKPDLTLVEAMLPRKHGFEVCQELKATPHGHKSPVLIVTDVYRGQRYRRQAIHQHGCDRYLEKPLDDRQLLDAIHEFLPAATPVAVEAVAESAPSVAPAPASEPEPSRVETELPVGAGAAVAETDPDLEAAELEIMSQLDSLFSDDPPAASGAKLPGDSNAEI